MDGVAHPHRVAVEGDEAEGAVEDCTCLPSEGRSEDRLLGPRSFPDEADVGLPRPLSGHEPPARLLQRAASALGGLGVHRAPRKKLTILSLQLLLGPLIVSSISAICAIPQLPL